MNARQHFATLARYNAWATRKLYTHVDAFADSEYRRDAGLFFNSVHGTLNHLLVGEHTLWFRRFAEGAALTAMDHACPEIDMVWMLHAESRRES